MSLYVDIRKKLGDFRLETQFEAAEGVTGIPVSYTHLDVYKRQ